MKKFTRYHFFIIGIALYSCQQHDKTSDNAAVAKHSSRKIRVEFDSITFKIDSSRLPGYSIFANDENRFIGYNATTHFLDVYDMQTGMPSAQIKLAKDGPNGIADNIQAIAIANVDTIFLLTEYSVSLVGKEGQVLKKIKINSASGNNLFIANNFFPFQSLNFFYDKLDRKLFLGNISYNYSQCDKRHYDAPLCASLNLTNDSISLLPLVYPAVFKEKNFGFQFEYGLSFTQDFRKVLYNFVSSADIYSYDLVSGIKNVLRISSEFTKNESTDIPWSQCSSVDLKMRHYTENPHFYKIIHDPYRNLYYRFHTKEIEYKMNSAGKFPTSSNKKQYLTVITENLEVIKEVELSDRMYFLDCAFVNEKGLYLSAPISENHLNFRHFKIYEEK